MKKSRLPLNEVFEDYKNGLGLSGLSRKYNCNHTTILYHLRKVGIWKRKVLIGTGPRHGTRTEYVGGCRCKECRKVNAEYWRVNYGSTNSKPKRGKIKSYKDYLRESKMRSNLLRM